MKIAKKGTKTWQRSFDSLINAVKIIQETAPLEIKRESKQRRKWIDNAWTTIRIHAPKLGVEVPYRGMFYDPVSDLDIADGLSVVLEAL
jgi:hypothetical protein